MILSLKWNRIIISSTVKHKVYIRNWKADRFKGFEFTWFDKIQFSLKVTLFYYDFEIGYRAVLL
jgi:hypothetical protein